jgi:hypothetical protein
VSNEAGGRGPCEDRRSILSFPTGFIETHRPPAQYDVHAQCIAYRDLSSGEAPRIADNEGCAVFFCCRSWLSSYRRQQAIRVSNTAGLGFGLELASGFASGSRIRVALDPVSITRAIVPIDLSTVTIQIQPAGSVDVVGLTDPLGVVARLSDDTPLGRA